METGVTIVSTTFFAWDVYSPTHFVSDYGVHSFSRKLYKQMKPPCDTRHRVLVVCLSLG